jgi:hypothetical protein
LAIGNGLSDAFAIGRSSVRPVVDEIPHWGHVSFTALTNERGTPNRRIPCVTSIGFALQLTRDALATLLRRFADVITLCEMAKASLVEIEGTPIPPRRFACR